MSVCVSLVQYSAASIFAAVIVTFTFLKCRFTLNSPMFARLVAINPSKYAQKVVFEALSNK